MIRSFRLRLALLASLLTGLALLAFGLGAGWAIREMRLQRLDHELRAHAERETGRRRPPAGWARAEGQLAADLGLRDARHLLLLVRDGDGRELYRSPHWPASLDARLAFPAPPGQAPRGSPPPPAANGPDERAPPPPAATTSLRAPPWHLGLARSRSASVAIGVEQAHIAEEMAGVRRAFFLALPPVLLLVALGAWGFSARALRPLEKLTAASRAITAQGLDRRLSDAGEDREFVELIEVFNAMLGRLENGFQQARRFSADAAHELKTPLAILQGQLERAIQAAEPGSPQQAELSGILDEVRRLSSISRKLLLLAQADAGRLRPHKEAVDLSELLREWLEDARLLAPHLALEGGPPDGLRVLADPDLLRQVLHNLLSNAIKYNLPGGWIRLGAGLTAQGVEIRVANASAGLPEEDRERIFDRFHRLDPARGRKVEGVGLGLSVARELARAHGGDLSLAPGPPGQAEFVLQLPRS